MKSSTLLPFAATALAQSAAYGQCGGKTWTGATSCVTGYTCTYSNDYYSQCVPSSNAVTSTTTTSAPTTGPTTPVRSGTGKFKWMGINESGAEFGDGKFPGVQGTDYQFPTEATIGVS